MASTDERVVRTTLDGEEYERFRAVAETEGVSVEEALRRAAKTYVETRESLDDLLGSIDDLDGSVGEPTSARNMDEDLYGRR